MPETRLQPARRVAKEGRQRIARQKAIVADLMDVGHDRMLPEADHLLEAMRATQAALEVNLDLEEREAGGLHQAGATLPGRGLWARLRAAWRGQ
jgi:hypothetical protein